MNGWLRSTPESITATVWPDPSKRWAAAAGELTTSVLSSNPASWATLSSMLAAVPDRSSRPSSSALISKATKATVPNRRTSRVPSHGLAAAKSETASPMALPFPARSAGVVAWSSTRALSPTITGTVGWVASRASIPSNCPAGAVTSRVSVTSGSGADACCCAPAVDGVMAIAAINADMAMTQDGIQRRDNLNMMKSFGSGARHPRARPMDGGRVPCPRLPMNPVT